MSSAESRCRAFNPQGASFIAHGIHLDLARWHGWQGLVAVPHGAVEDGLLLLLELDDLLLDGFGLRNPVT